MRRSPVEQCLAHSCKSIKQGPGTVADRRQGRVYDG
jgi:hypothetical protein